jgi:dTDP-4-amino-4,6-dideoxygalactose transaminase
MIKFLDLNAQYQSIKAEIDDAIAEVIAQSAFIGGKYVGQFEEEFGAWTCAEHCIGAGNGTDAIEIAIEALDLLPGSEIIVPANSFIASSEAVSRAGHTVVFADVDPGCYTISPDSVRRKITSKTGAIMAVHLYGHPCDMAELAEIAAQQDLRIIEDCAQAHGAEFNGQKVGTIGDVATFSFYPGKNLGAYGDGGAITTKHADLAKRVRMIANHGRIAKYNHEFEGRNSRLDGLQAAILSVKLKHLHGWTNHRIGIADQYIAKLAGVGDLVTPVRMNWARQVYHLFVIRTDRRDELAEFLAKRDIQTGVHYPIALPRLAAYHNHPQAKEEMFATRASEQLLSLPIGEHLDAAQIDRVCMEIKEFFEQ